MKSEVTKMTKSAVDIDAIHETCLNLRRVQQDLLSRDRSIEGQCVLAAIHRLIALAGCYESNFRPFEPISIPDMALPQRLRRHVFEDAALGHDAVMLQAAEMIEGLDRGVWKLFPARVSHAHLTPNQKAALLKGEWPADPRRLIESMHAKGYMDRAGNILRAGRTFVWRMMEHELNTLHAEHLKANCPILSMDSELMQMLRTDTTLHLKSWYETGMIVQNPRRPGQPHAILHPFYVWQIKVEKSAGFFLRENSPIDWIQAIPSPLPDTVAA
jgi:hypothetical protein